MRGRETSTQGRPEVRREELEPRRVVLASPLNAEADERALASDVTPVGAHFVRSHFPEPRLEEAHRFAIEGAIARARTWSRAELQRLERRTVTATFECAGNGRVHLVPLPEGEPWGDTAVGTASWSGVPLRRVLEDAVLRDDVSEILVEGADHGNPGGLPAPIRFARSLPLEKALDPDTLLAFEMNGAPLAQLHGAPVRLVVPGWYGVANVKWVARIEALAQPFDGYYQSRRYVLVDERGTNRGPLTEIRVKSLVVTPREGEARSPGRVQVDGWAWSGSARIASVEVALDGGDDWVKARLDPVTYPYAWTRWSAVFEVRHVVRARAIDGAGHRQPDVGEWNRYGYGFNAVVPRTFHVR